MLVAESAVPTFDDQVETNPWNKMHAGSGCSTEIMPECNHFHSFESAFERKQIPARVRAGNCNSLLGNKQQNQ